MTSTIQDQLSEDKVSGLYAPVGFADWQTAHRNLWRIAGSPETRQALAGCLPHLLAALAGAANPDRVLVNFERFAGNAADRTQLLRYLADNPRAVEILVTVFAGSQFLTEILLRRPEQFTQVIERKRLAQLKDAAQLHTEMEAALAPVRADSTLDALRRFQRRELLRIGTYDLLDLFDLPTVTTQLSHLADSLIQTCLTIAAGQSNVPLNGLAVIGMGKLGGEELNYSSDIDLLFVTDANAAALSSTGQQLIDALTRPTGEGFLYRVDMRLRPWGRNGPLVSSLAGHIGYLRKHAGLWEKQALLKARVIAGDETVGQEFLRQVRPLIFNTGSDTVQADVRTMKRRIEAQLRRRGRVWGEVKLGEGSIRDIEFVTQYLQLVHGGQYPDLDTPNTLDALARLSAGGFLSSPEYRVLADGYIFLRTVEHHLQLMHYRQTHTLPDDREALTHLARRLRFQGDTAGDQFVARFRQHSIAIRAVYRQHLEITNVKNPTIQAHDQPSADNPGAGHAAPIAQHMVRMPPAYVTTFSESDIERHAQLVDKLADDNLVEVEAVPLDDEYWRVTIVGYDDVGQLSLICGLLFIYGFDIVDGHVFSYGRQEAGAQALPARPVSPRRSKRRRWPPPKPAGKMQRKIVDVFTVRSVQGKITADHWTRYAGDLTALSERLHAGEQHEAQGKLVKRVAKSLREISWDPSQLYPVDIEIDNDASDRHTVLRIDAPDTIGFLYEFTNALALNSINVRRMTVDSVGNRVRDTLYVIDTRGKKITAPDKQRELRVATALIKQFTHLLPRSPNPESALLQFRQFIGHLFTRPDWPGELTSLEQPEVLDTLARLLGVSDFLWADFLRMQYANLFPVVRDVGALASGKSKQQLQADLEAALQAAPDAEAQRVALNDFKDREMFRIDIRQIQEHITKFGQFSAELTDLAEVIVETACRLCLAALRAEYGQPRLDNGRPCPMSLCALGKCGGRELGFASDIELMFLFGGSGQTTGPRVITTAEFYEKLVQAVNQAIRSKREGIFELDLRLRPYGRASSMAVSLDSFRRYFGPSGDAWPYERQALIKLRPIWGDPGLGRQAVSLRDELIYTSEPFDVAAMRAMRERQVRHLVTAGTINAKFSPGGLVDVEYLVQGLQISHGYHHPDLRLTNTREAMTALATAKFLTPDEYLELRRSHIFLRRLINALRMVRGNAKDLTVPPTNSEEFDFLARRLNYGHNPAKLGDDLTNHTTRGSGTECAAVGLSDDRGQGGCPSPLLYKV